jgi:L-threonylcarbamoyladenylate synthase
MIEAAMETLIGQDIEQAAGYLQKGELVAIPTETVYGLAGNALDAEAVVKIFKAKNRPQFNPLIVHVASLEHCFGYVTHFPETLQQLAHRLWPGSLTLLLPKTDSIPDIVTAGSSMVALRVPSHPLTLQLLQQLPFPLAAPSANPFGYVSPTTANHVMESLGGKIPYILDGGPCTIGVESTIAGCNEAGSIEVYRLGGVGLEVIESITGQKPILKLKADQPDTPGQLKSHYATSTPLLLHTPGQPLSPCTNRTVYIGYNQWMDALPTERQLLLAPDDRLETAARNLFGTLRMADKMEADHIFIELAPNYGIGRAINDRILRALHKNKEAIPKT